MGSNGGGKDVMISGSNEAKSSEATIEIKIKTLDSRAYTLTVDKCVPVPALKEQIATVTGVLSNEQRLICRGKVLKDDQLLSAYLFITAVTQSGWGVHPVYSLQGYVDLELVTLGNSVPTEHMDLLPAFLFTDVEDGHTLHLVVRQPITLPSEGFPDHPVTDPASSTGQAQGSQTGPSVVVGTFNISEQGDGGFPDFSRIVSAVLGSFGITNAGSGNEAVNLHEHVSVGLSRTPGLGDLRNSIGQQPEDAATSRSQPHPHNAAFSLPIDVPLESLLLPVIPDALTTLSQYLSRLRQDFSGNVRGQSNISQALGTHGSDGLDSNAVLHSAAEQGGLPTPASLAEVIQSTRQLLMEQAGECLMQLTRQLGDQANVTDSLARTGIQSNALRSGALLQNLGAFLLELGRTTMTLRMGQTPTDAVVNAGPAVFVSTSGPNPIMVQPLPFQPGSSFGATPVGNTQPGPSFSAFRPRNLDIRIRTGSLMPSAVGNQREPTAGEPLGQTDPAASGSGTSSHQAAARSSSSTRESEVRVVPIRTVVGTVPLGHALVDASRGSMGFLYPVLARAQHVDSANSNNTRGQASNVTRPHNVVTGLQRVPDSAVQQQYVEIPGVDGATHPHDGIQHGERFTTEVHSGLDQLLRNLFPGEQSHGHDFIFNGIGTNSASGSVETAQGAANSQEATRAGDDGIFLANLLQQIMPIVSQNMNGTNNSSPQGADGEDRTSQPSSTVEENPIRGTSSRRLDNPPSSPSSKRQKRE